MGCHNQSANIPVPVTLTEGSEAEASAREATCQPLFEGGGAIEAAQREYPMQPSLRGQGVG